MKKKLIAVVLSIVILAALAIPIVNAYSVTLVAHNPLGAIDIQQNIPLTSRDRFTDDQGNVDFNDRVIGLSWYTKTNNQQALQALGEVLQQRFPGVHVVNVVALGSPWNHKTDANYDLWAGLTPVNVPNVGMRYLDAVIFGVAD